MRGSKSRLTISVIALCMSVCFFQGSSLFAGEKSVALQSAPDPGKPDEAGEDSNRKGLNAPRGDAPLRIADFAFLQSSKGSPRPKGPFNPVDSVYTTFETTGFGVNRQGMPHLVVEMAVLDPDGLLLFEPATEEILAPAAEQDSIDGYHDFMLPSYAPSGDYVVRIKVCDRVKNADYEFKQVFQVEGGPAAAPTRLEIRECTFSATEGGVPAKPLTVKAGEKVYSTCKVAGMRFWRNQMDVRVSVQVTGPSGKVIHDKPDLILLQDTFFYHPPVFFEEISAWVGLPPDAPPGRYVWKYTITDHKAGRGADLREEFLVR